MAGNDAVARQMMAVMIVVLEGPGAAVPLDRCSSHRKQWVIIVMDPSNSDEVTTETAEVTAVGGNRR